MSISGGSARLSEYSPQVKSKMTVRFRLGRHNLVPESAGYGTRKKALGKEHPERLTSMTTLALTYWNQSLRTQVEANAAYGPSFRRP